MEKEQLEAARKLGARGQSFGPLWDKLLEAAFLIHGHICGGMPLGFRAGLAALNALGEARELNMAKVVAVETGTGHAAGCFADGVQMSTGCTFGKGLIWRTEYGKWALNLVERQSRKAVRVSVRPQVIDAAFKSPFVKMRHQGVAPTQIPLEIGERLVNDLLSKSDDELFVVSSTFDYPLPERPAASFNLIFCHNCGEAVAENKTRLIDGWSVCLPCAGYSA